MKQTGIWYLLKTWLRQSYDEMALLCWLSVLSALPWIGLLVVVPRCGQWVPLPEIGQVVVAVLISLLGVWCAVAVWIAVQGQIERILTKHDPDGKDFFRSLPGCFPQALKVLATIVPALVVLGVNVMLYTQMLSNHPFWLLGAIGITFWLLLMVCMVQVHLIPFLVHQNRPYRTLLGRAIKVAIWRPGQTIFVMVLQIALVYATLLAGPLLLIVPGMVAMLQVLSLLILLEDWRDPYEPTEAARKSQH